MTTDPGDLVLDPTCGSGTTAYVAEKWGRRWIAIDTSRVAVALARQRLLTGNFDYYKLKDESEGIGGGFVNKTVPTYHCSGISLKTPRWIRSSQNMSRFLKKNWRLSTIRLTEVTPEIRTGLLSKLAEKERHEGKKDLSRTQIDGVGSFQQQRGMSGRCRLTSILIGPKD